MKNYLLVLAGGGVGAVARYWLSGVIPRWMGTDFPYGIFAINILGCFLIGLLMTALEDRFLVDPALRIFLTVGILGGFTTFSSFSYETMMLMQDAEYLKAIVYVGGSVGLGLGGTIAGAMLGKML